MPLDINLMYIKQNIPHELWEQLKIQAHDSGKTLMEYFIDLLQNEIAKKPRAYTKKPEGRKSKFPEHLWAKAKARAATEGITFPELIKKIAEENCADEPNS